MKCGSSPESESNELEDDEKKESASLAVILIDEADLIFENEGDQVLMSAETKQLQLLNDAAFVQPWISCQTLCGTLIQLKFIIFLHYHFQ